MYKNKDKDNDTQSPADPATDPSTDSPAHCHAVAGKPSLTRQPQPPGQPYSQPYTVPFPQLVMDWLTWYDRCEPDMEMARR